MRVDVSPHGESVDGLAQGLVSCFDALGYQLIPVPNRPTLVPRFLETIKVDGILLSGGNDLNPGLYGGNIAATLSVSRERDETEKALLEFAIGHHMPVLGLCRGFQMINVFFGGGLLQNIRTEIPGAIEHVASRHPIQFTKASLSGLPANPDSCVVNSFHRQGVTRNELSKELEALAYSSDGVVEAARHRSKPMLGLMWHPERNGSDANLDRILIRSVFDRS